MLRPVVLPVCLLLLAPSARAGEAAALWAGSVQAILDKNCIKCHGPLEQKAGLALDTPASALEGAEDGRVIIPGKPDESPLVRALAADADPHMPPKGQLGPAEISLIRDWITALDDEPAASPPVATAPQAADHRPRSIDQFLAAAWEAAALTPAPPADDRTFLRRVSLDLIGRIPTPSEVETFLYDADANKRAVLVDRLLAGDEAARNFREIWDVLLMGRRAGRGEERRRDNGWFAFLEEAFKTNRPWNEVVASLIIARPATTADNGSQWFVFERRNDHQQIAEAIAPVIYGTRLDCAQCHDHPLAREIKQGHYWGLVSAFNRSKNIDKGSPAVAESAIGGFVNFTNLKKESQPAVLTMLTGTTIDEVRPDPGTKEEDTAERYLESAGLKVPKFSRRGALAQAATRDNPLLARSFVNHTWALLLGRGIVHPVDEMNSKNPPSHPALLDWLAQDFASHRFDVKRLVRMIVMSRAYQLAAWTGPTTPPPPPEAFAAAAEKPLTAEAIARSARIAAGHTPDDDALRKSCVERFPDVLPRGARATIQQAMFLANAAAFTGLFAAGPATEQITKIPTPEARARAAFRQVLLRDPQPDELAHSIEFIQARGDAPAEAAAQLLWALVSGPEFLTNH